MPVLRESQPFKRVDSPEESLEETSVTVALPRLIATAQCALATVSSGL